MRPYTILALAVLALVACDTTADDTTAGDTDADTDADVDTDADADRHHPAGWAASEQHGMGAKGQVEVCTSCHGADLGGGSVGVSCDGCHPYGWRTDCTFCHGGTDDATGAPPVDIDNLATGLSFPEHTVHVQETIHAAWDCTQCHVKPADVLSGGHVLVGDATPYAAEVLFLAGLSPAGTYGGAGSCSNLYCHGNGNGTLGSATSGTKASCSTCHPSNALGGEHAEHAEEGMACGSCHAATVSTGSTISDPAQHVDGEIDLSFPSGMGWNGSTCTGTCHSVSHSAWHW
jgi:hypothetical protein